MAELETLGDRLKARRTALGIRSTDLARRAGVSPSYVWLVETAAKRKPTERRQPSRDLLLRWASALGVSAEEVGEWLQLAGYEPTLTGPERGRLQDDQTPAAYWVLPRDPREEYEGRSRSADSAADEALRRVEDRLRRVMAQALAEGRQDEVIRLLDSYLRWLGVYLAE